MIRSVFREFLRKRAILNGIACPRCQSGRHGPTVVVGETDQDPLTDTTDIDDATISRPRRLEARQVLPDRAGVDGRVVVGHPTCHASSSGAVPNFRSMRAQSAAWTCSRTCSTSMRASTSA